MKLNIKQYRYEKIETNSKEIELPTEISYYFETHVRRSIRIIPIFTSERPGKENKLYRLDIVCLYNSSECKAERFSIDISEIEKIFYLEKHKYKEFVNALVNDWFDKRTKEQFEEDLAYTISKLQ